MKVIIGCVLPTRGLLVRQTYSNFGDRCFAAAGPNLWNRLPSGLKQTDIGHEQAVAKVFLFGREIAAHCE